MKIDPTMISQLQLGENYLDRAALTGSNVVSQYRFLLSAEFLVDKVVNGGMETDDLNSVLDELDERLGDYLSIFPTEK